jgi:acyl carrier protein
MVRMNVKQEIKRYIIDYILFEEVDNINENIPFQESAIFDSLGFLELITFVEKKFAIKISESELIPENLATLQQMSDFVEEKLNQKKKV